MVIGKILESINMAKKKVAKKVVKKNTKKKTKKVAFSNIYIKVFKRIKIEQEFKVYCIAKTKGR